VTTWHRGGGAKRLYRLIDFQRDQQEVAAHVQRLEYDPNRSARIALLQHPSGATFFFVRRPSEGTLVA